MEMQEMRIQEIGSRALLIDTRRETVRKAFELNGYGTEESGSTETETETFRLPTKKSGNSLVWTIDELRLLETRFKELRATRKAIEEFVSEGNLFYRTHYSLERKLEKLRFFGGVDNLLRYHPKPARYSVQDHRLFRLFLQYDGRHWPSILVDVYFGLSLGFAKELRKKLKLRLNKTEAMNFAFYREWGKMDGTY